MEDDGTQRRLEALSGLWSHFAERECAAYSPLYAAIARYVAEDQDLLTLILEAPPQAHLPNVLLAAVHYLLLDGLDSPLAALYAGDGPVTDAGALFKELCVSNRQSLLALMEWRRTQTNEPGRSAVLALGLMAAAAAIGTPLSMLDAGCSAGLNLHFDEYRLDYGPHGTLGPARSPVQLECHVRSERLPVPMELPAIGARLGLDRSPPDLHDPADARWLLACVWPDTGRLERTRAAVDLARRQGTPIRVGDMVSDLPAAMADLGPGPMAIITSWALAYLSPKQRIQFEEVLAQESHQRPVAWVSAEGIGVVTLEGSQSLRTAERPEPSMLGLTVFDRGRVKARPLALVHAHGHWVDWLES